MNIFDALNIFYREDVISDFLKECFLDSRACLNHFLSYAGLAVTQDYEIKNRVGLGRTIGTPDMIIVENHPVVPKVIVIENKLGTGEGIDQTRRYGSKPAKASMLKRLQLENAEFHYIFLTLDPTAKALNRAFTHIDYQVFLKGAYQLKNTVLTQILNDFKEKLDMFYRPLETPVLSLGESNELDNMQRMICWQSLLFNLFDENNQFEYVWGEVGGSGRNNFLFMVTKPDWKHEKEFSKTGLEQTFFIHIDVYINMLDNRENIIKAIGVRFETHPYVPHSKIKDDPYYHDFISKKNEFAETLFSLLKNTLPGARMGNSKLLVLSVPLKETEIKNNLEEYKINVLLIAKAVNVAIKRLGYHNGHSRRYEYLMEK